MNTNLVLTRNSPLRTVLVNQGTHQPLYKIETLWKITRTITRVYKILAPSTRIDQITDNSDPEAPSYPLGGSDSEEIDIPAESEEIARIYWHHFSSYRVVYNGRILKRSQLLPRAGSGYTFIVRDVKLRWKVGWLGISGPRLILDNGSKTVIAQFHLQRNIVNKRKAYLEITPWGMEILDDIIVTFVFVEKRRRD